MHSPSGDLCALTDICTALCAPSAPALCVLYPTCGFHRLSLARTAPASGTSAAPPPPYGRGSGCATACLTLYFLHTALAYALRVLSALSPRHIQLHVVCSACSTGAQPHALCRGKGLLLYRRGVSLSLALPYPCLALPCLALLVLPCSSCSRAVESISRAPSCRAQSPPSLTLSSSTGFLLLLPLTHSSFAYTILPPKPLITCLHHPLLSTPPPPPLSGELNFTHVPKTVPVYSYLLNTSCLEIETQKQNERNSAAARGFGISGAEPAAALPRPALFMHGLNTARPCWAAFRGHTFTGVLPAGQPARVCKQVAVTSRSTRVECTTSVRQPGVRQAAARQPAESGAGAGGAAASSGVAGASGGGGAGRALFASPPAAEDSAGRAKTPRSGLLDAEECARRYASLNAAQAACEQRAGRCAGVTRHSKPFGCLTPRDDAMTAAPELLMPRGWWGASASYLSRPVSA